MKRTLYSLCILCLLTGPALADGPKAMVEARYAEIQRIISTETSDKAVQKQVVAVLESFTDFREFGRLTMKRYWKDLSEKKKGVFVDKYRQLIHGSYSKR